MKLTTAERLALQGILPEQGDFISLKLVRKLREALSFSEAEIQALSFLYEIKCPKCGAKISSPSGVKCALCDVEMTATGSIRWNASKEPNKDVFMGKAAEKLCKEAIEKLSTAKKLTEQHMSLYEKFIGDPSVEE